MELSKLNGFDIITGIYMTSSIYKITPHLGAGFDMLDTTGGGAVQTMTALIVLEQLKCL